MNDLFTRRRCSWVGCQRAHVTCPRPFTVDRLSIPSEWDKGPGGEGGGVVVVNLQYLGGFAHWYA